MARRKDLAGLATLAGLAYMASRDKGGEAPAMPTASPTTPDTAPDAMDAMTSGEYGGPNRGGDIMTDKEPGWGSKKVAPSATPRPRPTAPMGGSGRGGQGGATAEELAAYAASKKPKLQYQSLQDRARGYEEERAKSGAPGMYGTRTTRREPLPTAEDMAYKKGGSVKGWGAARGARKAKIY